MLVVFRETSNVSAQDYTVEGSLVHTDYLGNGTLASRFEEQFKIMVSGSKWVIRETREDHGKLLQKELGFDGTNTFQVATFPYEEPPQGKPVPIFIQGSIQASDMPAPQLVFSSTPIWLAYASGRHLSKAESGKLRPLCMLNEMGLWNTGFKVPASWKVSKTPPYVPEEVTCLDDGKTHPLDGSEARVLYAPFPNVVYTARFTNVDGLALPIDFTLTRFNFSAQRSEAGGRVLAAKDEAVAYRISPRCDLHSFRPGLTGVALVTDCRLEQKYWGRQPRYIVTNGEWNLMPYEKLAAYHEKTGVVAMRKDKRRTKIERHAVLWGMFLSTAAFAVLGLRGRHKEGGMHV